MYDKRYIMFYVCKTLTNICFMDYIIPLFSNLLNLFDLHAISVDLLLYITAANVVEGFLYTHR